MNTKRLVMVTALIALAAAAGQSLKAEMVTEAVIGSAYQDNIFSDSNSTGDMYTSFGLGMKYYPSASTQITAAGSYNAFAKYSDLSNLSGDLSVMIIPTAERSRLALALAGGLSLRDFGEQYERYNQAEATVGADLTYRLTPSVRLLTAVSWLTNSYENSDYGSHEIVDVAAGINLTVAGRNSLALRVDYSNRTYDQMSLESAGGNGMRTQDSHYTERFDILGAGARFSRPLTERTGVNFSAGHQWLQVDNGYAVPGYTIDYLSPWRDLWEGYSFSAGLKHFFPNQITGEITAAYSDREFVDVIELQDADSETFRREARYDQLTSFSMSAAKSFALKSGPVVSPTVFMTYRKNKSSAGFYDYEDLSVSLTLKATF